MIVCYMSRYYCITPVYNYCTKRIQRKLTISRIYWILSVRLSIGARFLFLSRMCGKFTSHRKESNDYIGIVQSILENRQFTRAALNAIINYPE